MDIDDLAPIEGPIYFVLTHPGTGLDLERDGNPVEVAILGPDTKEMVDFEHALQQRRLDRAARTGKISITAEELESEAISRAAKALAGWRNLAVGGEEPAFSEAAARELVTRYRWIRDFVTEKLANRGNFIGGKARSAKS